MDHPCGLWWECTRLWELWRKSADGKKRELEEEKKVKLNKIWKIEDLKIFNISYRRRCWFHIDNETLEKFF